MDQNEDKKNNFLEAIDSVEKKHKPKSKQKEQKEKLITVKPIGEYKNNEIAVNVNNFLSKNIDEDAGKVLFGENLARAGEYYGLKATPLWGLIISSIGLAVIIFRVAIKKKKQGDGNTGSELKNVL
ncbi:hypothetical protein ES702_07283 [subsurface metagenome]